MESISYFFNEVDSKQDTLRLVLFAVDSKQDTQLLALLA